MGEQFEVGLPKPNEAAPPSLQHQSAPVEREWRVEPRNDWAAPKDNGWVLSHDAIRADLEDTMQVVARLAAAAAVEAWEHEYLVAWWARVAEYIIHHHRHEEDLFFPKVQERVEIIDNIVADHRALSTSLTALNKLVAAASEPAACAALKPELRTFRELIEPHLLDEEEDTLPKLMRAFERDEIRPVEQEMMKSFTWSDFPHMLRRLGPSVDAKRALACDRMGMPEPVFKKKADDLARYEYEYASLVNSLLDPARKPAIDQERAAYQRTHRKSVGGARAAEKPQQGSWLARMLPCL